MATLNEMKEVLKEHLEQNGTLNEIRSKMRAEIFNTLNNQPKKQDQLTNQNLIINELIREYLVYNNYNYTNSVLIPEANQPARPLERQFIASQLNVVDDTETRKLPLLYSIVFGIKVMAEEGRYDNDDGYSNSGQPGNRGDGYGTIFEVKKDYDGMSLKKGPYE